jgi:hypothetical protein
VPTKFQIYKYTYKNLIYYTEYIKGVLEIPFEKLKFIDEAHIVSRELTNKKVYGLVGKRVYTKERTLRDASASITLMTTLSRSSLESPLFSEYRVGSNTQWNFTDFVYNQCCEGNINSGDTIICDNASVHLGSESYKMLWEILDTFGVSMKNTPKYCPELNPVELVFAKLKNHMRWNRGSDNLEQEVAKSLAQISKGNVENFYKHCVLPKVILPDLIFSDSHDDHLFDFDQLYYL